MDFGASRRVASFLLRRAAGNPLRQRELEAFIDNVIACLRTLFIEQVLPGLVAARIMALYGYSEYPRDDDPFLFDPEDADAPEVD